MEKFNRHTKYLAKRGTPVQNYFGKGEWIEVSFLRYLLLKWRGFKVKKAEG